MTKRLAIVGYGKIAPKHMEVVHALGAKVVASVNRSPQGRERATQAGIPATYADVERMIDLERPDGIICSTSYDQLFDTTRRLIPYRIPILLEKPGAASSGQLEQLIQLAGQHQTPIMIALNR